jgi:hypothetical protein
MNSTIFSTLRAGNASAATPNVIAQIMAQAITAFLESSSNAQTIKNENAAPKINPIIN